MAEWQHEWNRARRSRLAIGCRIDGLVVAADEERTDPEGSQGFAACWVGGAGLGIFALTQGAGWIGGIPAGLAALAGTFFSVLVLVSPQKVADSAIQVGERLREFTAPDENGDAFAISSVAGSPVLLKFFRGHW